MTGFHHEPVLLQQVVDALAPADGELFVDCTLGGGGHTRALLAAADCRVIGIDRDPAALAACADLGDRVTPVRGRFSDLGRILTDLGIEHVDGVLADIGVSSHQLDTAERGFSFRHAGPLDMRMDPDAELTAADIVNTWDEPDIADVIRRYGEERQSKRIARAIVAGRPWTDTASLAAAVATTLGGRPGRIHPATRTFQALRIAVNDELGELQAFLPLAHDALKPGGRLAVITFHSLEDRIVKRFLAERAGKGRPRDAWGNPIGAATLRLSPSVVAPPDDPNPRARSARLRSAVRLPWNAQ